MLSFAIVAVVLGGAVSAGTKQQAPEGIRGGRAVFAPWFRTDVLADDNIFRRTESQNPIADLITTMEVGVGMYVPIRMSNLYVGYEGSTFFYQDTNFEGSETHAGTALFDLNFSSHNTLTLAAEYTNGVTQLQEIDDAGELIRQGIPFTRDNWAVEWSRMVAQRPSYMARVEWVDHRYSADQQIPWLNYEGWDVRYEFRQPIYRRGDLTAKYSARRQEHFAAGSSIAVDGPLRRERYDGLEIGFRGFVGRRQPLVVSLGYGNLGYRDVVVGEPSPDFEGLVGDLYWRLPVGGVTNMEVSMRRRPLSSSFNTYFIINELRVSFDRRLLDISRYGFATLYARNRYGAIIDNTLTGIGSVGNCGDPPQIRRDKRKQIEGFWEWLIQPRMALRLTAGHNRRDSNCPGTEYVSNEVGLSFRLGWFD